MKGDFTRSTFKKGKHYRRVNMQQGRVQLDADWNEELAIALNERKTICATLVDYYGKEIPLKSQVAKSGKSLEIELPKEISNAATYEAALKSDENEITLILRKIKHEKPNSKP